MYFSYSREDIALNKIHNGTDKWRNGVSGNIGPGRGFGVRSVDGGVTEKRYREADVRVGGVAERVPLTHDL